MNRLTYHYYVNDGTPWTVLPDFSRLPFSKTGSTDNIDISVKPADRNDNFAFTWQGYLSIPVAGNYTFETISDDGSKFYFNSGYASTLPATVNNDGLHAARAVSGTVAVAVPGIYPISVAFFEQAGFEQMQLSWSGPGIAKQRIPNEAFVLVKTPFPSLSPAISVGAVQNAAVAVLAGKAADLATTISAYPNPFAERLTISFRNPRENNVITVSLVDMTGRKVYTLRAGKLPAGNNILRLDLPRMLKEGMYVTQVYDNGILVKSLDVIKVKR